MSHLYVQSVRQLSCPGIVADHTVDLTMISEVALVHDSTVVPPKSLLRNMMSFILFQTFTCSVEFSKVSTPIDLDLRLLRDLLKIENEPYLCAWTHDFNTLYLCQCSDRVWITFSHE